MQGTLFFKDHFLVYTSRAMLCMHVKGCEDMDYNGFAATQNLSWRHKRNDYILKVWRISVWQATGPLNQATGPPQSDAGVGIGMLIGDREYIARK